MYDYEKTLDLCSTYDEPAIDLIEEDIDFGAHYGVNKIIQIRGLKDKNVENKINNDIKEKYIDIIKNYEEENNVVLKEFEISFSEIMKFPNAIFADGKVYVNDSDENEIIIGTCKFNYELVTGSRIRFDDLFKSDYDTKIIVKQAVYKAYQNLEVYDEFGSSYEDGGNLEEVYFDYDKKEWMGTYHDYNVGEEKEEKYFPRYSEYELSKIVERLYNKIDNNTYLRSNGISFQLQDTGLGYSIYLFYKDYKDVLTIFDKYKTKESIYEDDSKGRSLVVCYSESMHGVDYKDSEVYNDHSFYDITIGYSSNPDGHRYGRDSFFEYPINIDNQIKSVEEKLKEDAKNIILKYKEQSDKNDNGYILLVKGFVYPYSDKNYEVFKNIIRAHLSYKVAKYNKEEFESIFPLFLDEYRYRSVDYYGGAYNFVNGTKGFDGLLGANEYYCEFEPKDGETLFFDVLENKYVDNLEEYKIIPISPIFKNSSNEYLFDFENGIHYKDDYEREYNIYTDFDFAKYKLNNFDNEELNIAYNEIFARHGHDFKSKELKDYFSLFDWYKPISGKVVSMNELSDVERKNAEMILKIINDRKS